MCPCTSSRTLLATLLLAAGAPVLALAQPDAPAQTPLPILDMHLHALPAHELGVVPVALCLPMLT